MRINQNIAALNAWRNLTNTDNAMNKSLERLSSGLRINRAADDAAGLAISEKMRGQIRGLNQAMRNAQDGISLIQTAEGALAETHSILQRMRELAVQSASDSNTDSDRAELQKEIDQLAQELTRIANDTEFNTLNLLGGNLKGRFHIGANQGQGIDLSVGAMDAFTLGVARDAVTLTGTVNGSRISNVTFGGTIGAGLVDGANITLGAAANNGVNATGTLDVNGQTLTVNFGVEGAVANGINIVFGADSDAALSATWNAGTRTVTVTADWDNDNGNAPADLAAIETAIQNADGSLANVTLTGAGVNIADLDNAGTITLAGGADADPTQVILTLSDGTTTQQIVVADDATSVSVTSGYFSGLSFDVTDLANIDAGEDSIDIAGTVTSAAAAVFTNGQMTSRAVAEAGIDISTQPNADAAIATIQNAIDMVSAERSKLGAYQNRLEHTINNLSATAENLTAAESRVRDADMASEMTQFTRNQILIQAGTAMLAQANQKTQSVLQLLR